MCKAPNYMAFTGWKWTSDNKAVVDDDDYYLDPSHFGQRRVRDYKFLGHLPHDSVCNTYYDDELGRELPIIQVPCGQCLECRLQQTRVWADRCVLEAKQWEHNYFVTLTYDDYHIPPNGSLVKRDYQLFLKKLRKIFPGFRYLLSGEYGTQTLRPHYHLILFNLPLDDLSENFKEPQWDVNSGFNKDGEYIHELKLIRLKNHVKPESGEHPLFYSKTIHKCWDYRGMISVGRFSYDTAAYISQYCTKKVNPKNKDRYVQFGMLPEFLACSTHPGIGAGYAEEKDDLLYSFDKLVIANKDGAHLSSIPRYFDKLFKKKYGDGVFEPIRYKRMKKTIETQLGYNASSRFYDRECEDRDQRLIKRQKLKSII